MEIMKLLPSGLLSVLLAAGMTISVQMAIGQVRPLPKHKAHPHAHGKVIKPKPLRVRSNHYLHRTAFVIKKAQISVRDGNVRTGKFARSVALQRHARALWNRKDYRRAVHFSHRARVLAVMAIRENKGQVDHAWETAEDEKDMLTDAPADSELDKGVTNVGKDEDLFKDDLNDIDVGEVEEGDYH